MPTQNLRLKINGMSCQACAARIERVLNKQDYVYTASVNFAGEEAQVAFNPQQASADDIVRAIGRSGFQAQAVADNPFAAVADVQEPMPWRTRLLLVLAALFLPGMLSMAAGSHALMLPLWVQAALAALAQCGLAWPFYRSAWAALRGGAANMDVLVSGGTLAIFVYSLAAAWAGFGADGVYFEAGVMVLAFVSLGKHWEVQTKRGSLNSLRGLLQLMPPEAEVWRDGAWRRVAADTVAVGDLLRATDGMRIAADGVVCGGAAWADESHLTGESLPVAKQEGSRVLAGALVSGSLQYRAERLGSETLLGDMLRALAEAQGSKAPIARLADRIAAVFVPAVGALAALTFVLTWWVGGDVARACVHAAAVLVAACPCALGLATPAAVMAGMGVAVRHGIWFKNAAVLERAGQVDTLVLDKTGTLTEGQPQVAAVWCAEGWQENALLTAAVAVEQHAAHPFARRLAALAAERGLLLPQVEALHGEAGMGMRAQVDGIGLVCVGKLDFCGFRLPENGGVWDGAGVAAVSVNGAAAGAFAFADTPKPDSAAAVARLMRMGVAVRMFSGDNAAAVARTAAQLGITQAQGEMLPRDKAEAVRRLMAEGAVVGMAGDGINDAPALAAADIGLAVYGGTDTAGETADVVLMRPSPLLLADALAVARATLRTIRLNLFFAFFYNVLVIPLAAFGYLTPAWAGAAMALSSVSVLLNALWLKRFRADRQP